MTIPARPPGTRRGKPRLPDRRSKKRARTGPPALAGRLEKTKSKPRLSSRPFSLPSPRSPHSALGPGRAFLSCPVSGSVQAELPFSLLARRLRSAKATARLSLSLSRTSASGKALAAQSPMTPIPQPSSRILRAEARTGSRAATLRSNRVPTSMSNEEKRAWERSKRSSTPLNLKPTLLLT